MVVFFPLMAPLYFLPIPSFLKQISCLFIDYFLPAFQPQLLYIIFRLTTELKWSVWEDLDA